MTLLVAAGALFYASKVIDPAPSNAAFAPGSADERSSMDGYAHAEYPVDREGLVPEGVPSGENEAMSLGRLTGPEFTIEIYAGNPEPLYTVLDAGGNVLVEMVTAKVADETIPELNLREMGDAPAGSLMADAPMAPPSF